MTSQPNILFLMCDQLQNPVLEPDHPCQTPNFDRLAARGARFRRAYTPNAVCSPARASLMTGLLPHNHGVLTVTHTVDDDQSCLRTDYPHWAQQLSASGYRSGYFGKWHVERSNQLDRFGWRTYNTNPGARPAPESFSLMRQYDGPPGYNDQLFYGVTSLPPTERSMGVITQNALDYLDQVLDQPDPWCCFVSVPEPHDPFVTGEEAFARYDIDNLPLSPNTHDNLAGRPGLYRKAARVWQGLTDRERREAAACYYASVSEIDAQFGRLIDRVTAAGKLNQTIIILTSDHGELLGAHGLYCKNVCAAEEVYNIPLIVSGPGIASNVVTSARVGLHDLCPTLLELSGNPPFQQPDSRSFAPVLRVPSTHEGNYTTGFAEYYGGRIYLTQRVVWDDPWKFVFNGFDLDELYHLEHDPYELVNLANDPGHEDRVRAMAARMWQTVLETGDHSLFNSHYPPLRLAPFGPDIIK